MVRLLCSEIWVFAFVGWRYVPSPPVLSRVNNNVMLIICHTVQHKIDFYLWNFKSTIRRMCLFMFWCWACHKTESTDLPFEYEHVCHGVPCHLAYGPSSENMKSELRAPYSISNIMFPPRHGNQIRIEQYWGKHWRTSKYKSQINVINNVQPTELSWVCKWNPRMSAASLYLNQNKSLKLNFRKV